MDETPPLERLRFLLVETKRDQERVQKELRELSSLLEQSKGEAERLTQRNAQVTHRLRQVELNWEDFPKEEIKETYKATQDSQMRLFTIRSQIERLESKREGLQNQAAQMRQFLEVAEEVEALLRERSAPTSPATERTVLRVIEAQENERRRLARQIHDGPAQSLTNLILQAEICERLLDSDPALAREELENLKRAVNDTFQKTRRFIFGVRPMMLDDLGLLPTLKRYVQDFKERSDLSLALHILGKERRLPSHTEVTIFRAVQELLNNIEQHANASHVGVTLNLEGENVVITVEDDGSGFDVEEALASSKERKTVGLATIQERIEMLGGEMEVDSNLERGTKVRLELPGGEISPPGATGDRVILKKP